MTLPMPFRTLFLPALALLLAWSSGALAHAVLVDTAPTNGAALAAAPSAIELRFNEPVMPVGLRVLDAGGRPVDVPAPAAQVTGLVRAALPADLPVGGYLVSWRVVSTDSHPIGGSFVFSVGDADIAAVGDDQTRREAAWKRLVIVNRAVGDLGLLLAAGGALTLLLVFRGPGPRGAAATIAVCGLIAMASAVLSIGLARGWIGAAPLGALAEMAMWAMDADAPHLARTVLMVAGLAIVVLGLCWRRRAGQAVAALGGIVACAGVPLSGHVVALTPALPGQIALFLHATTAAFWIGALPLLLLALRQSVRGEAHRLLRRFSTIAMGAVALLVLGGVGVALTRVSDLGVLTESAYGRLLLAKTALVGLMLVLAAVNRRLTGTLPAVGAQAAARLNRHIRLEIALAGAVLAVTAWLGHTRPPDEPSHAHASASDRAVSAENNGAHLLVEIAPGRRGMNRLTGRIAGPDGGPLHPRALTVELALPARGIEPLGGRVMMTNDGGFIVDSVMLPLPGQWQLRVDALIGDFDKRVFTLQIDVE